MYQFNHNIKTSILNFLQEDQSHFQIISMYGDFGTGKSTAISAALEYTGLPSYTISFFEDSLFPFKDIIQSVTNATEEEAITIFLSEKLLAGKVLVFSNMEYCGIDYLRLLARIFKYHKNHNNRGIVILEYNSTKKPIDLISSLTDKIIHIPLVCPEVFESYLTDHFLPCNQNKLLFSKIISIANGNINDFFITLNILRQECIITKKDNLFFYQNTTIDLPDKLIQLFSWFFDRLDQATQEPLRAAAPFSSSIYIEVLRVIVRNFNQYEAHLKILSEYNSLIKKNKANQMAEDTIFNAPYKFTTEFARNAICHKMSVEELNDFIGKYYDYLDKIYHNKGKYNDLTNLDRIHLAIILVKNRTENLKVTHIPLIIDIMNYYYKHFLYFNAVEYGKMVIESKILNYEQLNDKYHEFYLIYSKSLLAIGNYEDIISFEKIFDNDDLNYYIALAYYNQGSPYRALDILNKFWKNDFTKNPGYREALMASIYDWLGDSKASQKHFENALKKCHSEPELKNQLFKRYSMFIDFRLPECQNRMTEALNYYKYKNLKQYAECLHNYGTGCVMIGDFVLAQKYLKTSKEILEKICDEEVYYPINSMAIQLCFEAQDFENAIALWNLALQSKIQIDFCYLALKNNLLNAYIHQNDWNNAGLLISSLRADFSNLCTSSNPASKSKNSRPDIQHQLRQFYYNCAVVQKLKGEKESALAYFQSAKKCSQYSSVSEYAIEKNILEIETELKQNKLSFMNLKNKLIKPTPLEKHIYEHDMYLCEIMFWG